MSLPPQPPGQDGADPSMEDILASIRRILNEDENPSPQDPPRDGLPTPTHVEGAGGGDVFMLDESMMVPDQPAPDPQTPVTAAPSRPTPLLRESVSPSPSPPAVPATVLEAGPPPQSGLIAAETESAAVNSVGSLLRTLSAERATQVYRGGPTLEELAREEMRPLLAAWLDKHLPPMVERLVRIEIERVLGRAVP
jgi:cell pole-organizing protein PopZ